MFVCEFQLGSFRLKKSALDIPFGKCRLTYFAWDIRSATVPSMGTLAWELSVGNFSLESLSWELLLGDFAWKCSFGAFGLGTSAEKLSLTFASELSLRILPSGTLALNLPFGTWAWERSLGNLCLENLDWDHRLGKLGSWSWGSRLARAGGTSGGARRTSGTGSPCQHQ